MSHWLSEIILPTMREAKGKSLKFSRPWQIGSRCVATDGYILVAVEGLLGCDDAPPEVAEKLSAVMAPVAPEVVATLDVSDLRLWAGAPVGPQQEKCDQCNGKAFHECDCGDEHDCRACEGEGTVTVPTLRWGTIAGVCVDRERLSLPFQHLTGAVRIEKDRSGVAKDTGVIRFVGPDWLVVTAEGDGKPDEGEECPELLKGVTT